MNVSIPSVELARLAADLADARIKFTHPAYGGIHARKGHTPVGRWDVKAGDYPASAEYYRIIDRISRGEKP